MSTACPIRLNGEPFDAPAGSTIAELVRALNLPEDRVAVELDRAIVRRADWGSRLLEPGSQVEIVQLVSGG